jgi:Tfp pilus assembly protein PilO
MSALIKKNHSSDTTVVEINDQLVQCVRRLRVIERVRPSGAQIDLLMEKVSDTAASSMLMTITHVQDLDDLILALTALRETYE